MRIEEIMTKDVITVNPETKLLDAQKMMMANNIRRLPVVDHGKLVGIITEHDLNESTPSRMNPMGAQQLHYMLSKMKVKDVMKKNPITVSPYTPFEDALRIGQEKKIGSFPVVEDGKLVGITTESDIVRFLIHALGIGKEGSRITITELKKTLEQLEKIISIINQNKTKILSMLVLPRRKKADWMVALRLDTNNPKTIIQHLKKEGFHVTWAIASVKPEW
jgi:acetoin utilization protein AcuB